jgi:hypothetical protein
MLAQGASRYEVPSLLLCTTLLIQFKKARPDFQQRLTALSLKMDVCFSYIYEDVKRSRPVISKAPQAICLKIPAPLGMLVVVLISMGLRSETAERALFHC